MYYYYYLIVFHDFAYIYLASSLALRYVLSFNAVVLNWLVTGMLLVG